MNNERNHEGHDEYEEHEAVAKNRYAMRIAGPLSEQAERVMSAVIGCALVVHKALGPGFIESIYRKAMCIELTAGGLRYEQERPIKVAYRGTEIPGQRIDLIVESLVIVELKAVIRIDEVHRAQLVSYLRTTGLRGGLLINFRVPMLRQGLRRVVL
jgi:GxxExxY protein